MFSSSTAFSATYTTSVTVSTSSSTTPFPGPFDEYFEDCREPVPGCLYRLNAPTFSRDARTEVAINRRAMALGRSRCRPAERRIVP